MRRKGKDLHFISSINRDGSGTEKVSEDIVNFIENEWFEVNRLSITLNTYIASGFNSYVVKLKDKDEDEQ